MKKVLFFICSILFIISSVNALEDNSLSPKAKSAIVIEASTGEVIYEYNASKKLAPASMTKMMS